MKDALKFTHETTLDDLAEEAIRDIQALELAVRRTSVNLRRLASLTADLVVDSEREISKAVMLKLWRASADQLDAFLKTVGT